MLQERLILKNFGPIKELDIEIKPLMVFIGESGSGKSAILKLMSLLRWIHKHNNLQSFLKQNKDISLDKLFMDNLSVSEIEEFINNTTEITFTIDKTEYILSNGNFIAKNINENEVTFDKVVFLTENRGILPYVKSNKMSLSVSSSLPYFFQDTFDNFIKANDSRKSSDFRIEATQLVLFNEESDKNQLLIKDEKGKFSKLKLENASSGTKTALPIELIVDYYTDKFDFKEVLANAYRRAGLGSVVTQEFDKAKKLSIFIEEPELSLFPSAQRRLINRLVKDCFVENKQENCTTRLAFATHSPYILTSLNNLLLAGETAKSKPQKKEEINKIVPKEYWLTMEQVGAFSIENGRLKSAIYEDENLINGDYLDSLSEEISEEFSKLLDIKYEEEGN